MEKGLKKRKGGQELTEVVTTQPLLKEGKEEKDSKNGKENKKGTTWRGIWTKIRMLWPYMWPKKNILHQIRIVVCLLILILTRGVTVVIPIYYKKIIDSMTPQIPKSETVSDENIAGNDVTGITVSEPPDPVTASFVPGMTTVSIQGIQFRWDYILIYMLLKSLHGPSGYLNIFRSLLWIQISQNTRKKMRVTLFKHLHNLSLRWHLQRKTGEVLRVMDRGVSSINLLLSQVLFSLLPVLADVVIAVVFFTVIFNVWTGLIVFSTMFGYVLSTVFVTEWRTKYRRQFNDADNNRQASSVDSILNFETVKYHAAEDFEVNRYSQSIDNQMDAEWLVTASMNLLNFLQKTMMTLGLMGGSLLCAWYVSEGTLTIGDYVLFGSYVEQLYGPLNQFGAMYRNLQQAFVDMENMFDMLNEEQEVKDVQDAPELCVSDGQIKFDNVNFLYNEKKAVLKNISFTVPPGNTFALVGQSGGGKSTIIRLLLRFYDIQSGTISIDGQDISKVQMKSLREELGVVPQDTVLFNDTVRYNIRYGKHTASDQEIEEAAQAADIHEKIISLIDGYESKVGERGLKLSGGEKQRVAIARTILKSPKIVLLDEATSALDTKTERNIQASLTRICENRTTLVVAHRLSTIIGADQILVLKDGEVVETGKHSELLSMGGLYWSMWQEQLDNDLTESDASTEDLENLQSPVSPSVVVACTCKNTTETAKNDVTDCRKCSGEGSPVSLHNMDRFSYTEDGHGDLISSDIVQKRSNKLEENDDESTIGDDEDTQDIVVSVHDQSRGKEDFTSSKA